MDTLIVGDVRVVAERQKGNVIRVYGEHDIRYMATVLQGRYEILVRDGDTWARNVVFTDVVRTGFCPSTRGVVADYSYRVC